METLKVKIVSFENNIEDNYKMIAFGDDEENPENYVILQRSIVFDDQDSDLGLDSYYLEINDQSNSDYSACDKAILKDGSLTFYFDKSKNIELDGLILDLSETSYNSNELTEYLTFILEDVLVVANK